MKIVTAAKARNNLNQLIDETAKVNGPIYISGKRKNALLLSVEYWKAIQGTIYLLSIPKMKESIINGIKIPLDRCSNNLNGKLKLQFFKINFDYE